MESHLQLGCNSQVLVFPFRYQAASKEVQTKVKHTGQCHDIKRRLANAPEGQIDSPDPCRGRATLSKALAVYRVCRVLRVAPLFRRCRDGRSLLSLRCEHVTKEAAPVGLQPEMQGDAMLFHGHTPLV